MTYNCETEMYEGYNSKITNDIDYKIYIGQTRRAIDIRWKQHIRQSIIVNGDDYFHRVMPKYGLDKFNIDTIECFQNKSLEQLINVLNQKEKEYIIIFNSFNNQYGYNSSHGGEVTFFSLNKKRIKEYDITKQLLKKWENEIYEESYYEINESHIYSCASG